MRVWVPFRSRKTIGMIVSLQREAPEFQTKSVEKLLDDEPVLSKELLSLTKWIHQFYYCGWGEAIQAALPSGLNFYSQKFIQRGKHTRPASLTSKEIEIIEAIEEEKDYPLEAAKKRWKGNSEQKALQSFIDKKY